MEMTFRQKVEEAEKQRVHLPANSLEKEIFGVYGFFAVKENKEECFYIGKATNMVGRLLGSGGHVHDYLCGHFNKLVPQTIRIS